MYKKGQKTSYNILLYIFLSLICSQVLQTKKLYGKRALTIGGAQMDIFVRYRKDVNLGSLSGQKIEIFNPSDYVSTGGGAVNAAIGFKRLGFTVSTFLKLGNDERSLFFIKKLEAEGILTDSVIYSNDEGTGVSYIIPSPNRDNCILIYRGANKFAKETEVPEEEIKKSSIIYITSLSGESSKIFYPITSIAKKNNTIVAANPGKTQFLENSNNFQKAIQNVDIITMNKSEAEIFIKNILEKNKSLKTTYIKKNPQITDTNLPELLQKPFKFEEYQLTLGEVFKIILNFGPKIVVITNGVDGVYVATNEKIYYHPSIPTDVVSTTGGGDAFGSCFVATLLKDNKTIEEAIRNKTIKEATRNGVLNSSSVVGYMDTNKGMLNQEELSVKAKKIGKRFLKIFDLKSN